MLSTEATTRQESRFRQAGAVAFLTKPIRVMELLVADQPKQDVAHDPRSKFWHWAEAMEVTASRFPARPGMTADITVFDPDTVAPGPVRRIRDFPADGERLTADAPVGMAHVLVNGVPIRVDGAPVPDARPGVVLRA